jgi:branched-chain amino acid transport system substrate-binding protein
MTTDHNPGTSDDSTSDATAADAHFESLARTAGAELRKPAPIDGVRALEDRRRAVVRARTAIACGMCAVLVIGAIGIFAIRSSSEQSPAVDHSEVPISSTTIATSTNPSTTVIAVSPETDWALSYVNGTAARAAGEPVRIGYVNQLTDAEDINYAVDAAVGFLNAELGGVSGRPIELVRCSPARFASDKSMRECATQMRDDPTVTAVIVGLIDSQVFYDTLGTSKPTLVTTPPFVASDCVCAWSHSDTVVGIDTSGAVNFSFEPSFNSLIRFAAKGLTPKPAKVAVVIGKINEFPTIPPQIAAVVPGASLVFVDVSGGSVKELTEAIQAANATDADAFVVFGDAGYCDLLPEGLDSLDISPVVVAMDYCATSSSMGERLTKHGSGGLAPDGWYVMSAGYNQFEPDLDSGWLTYRTKFDEYAEVPADAAIDFAGRARRGFTHMLALAKVINAAGGPGVGSDALRVALTNFKGPMMTQAGPIDCEAPIRVAGTLSLASVCADYASVARYENGRWTRVTDAFGSTS